MIHSVSFAGAKGSYPAALPFWGTSLSFAPGLNAIVGPNASGKTTLLRLLAGFCSLHELREGGQGGGLPMVGAEPRGSLFRNRRAPQPAPDSPEALALLHQRLFEAVIKSERGSGAPTTDVRAAISWDRQPVLYASGASAFATPSYLGETGDVGEEINAMFSRRSSSSSQTVIAKINRAIGLILHAKPLRFDKVTLARVNDHWGHRVRTWNAWMALTPHDGSGPRTLLLDEPDLSLSPVAQLRLWGELAKIAEQHTLQIIAVSHSPFALLAPAVTELVPGYAAAMDGAMRQYASRAPERVPPAPTTPVAKSAPKPKAAKATGVGKAGPTPKTAAAKTGRVKKR